MDFNDRINDLAERLLPAASKVETEEATKNALILPFIQELGYDVFDPAQVVPEFTADVGIKRGEKVDYALLRHGRPIILFECKPANADLADAHMAQLYRYFTVTDARFAVLTNGLVYQFYTDLDQPNRMDERPFLVVDLAALEPHGVAALHRMARDEYDE